MKKRFFQFGMALLAVASTAVFTACSDDDETVPSYNLTVSNQLPEGYQAGDIQNVKLILGSATSADTISMTALKDTTLVLRQGDYKVTVQGKIAGEATGNVIGTANVSLYADVKADVRLAKVNQSTLIIKTIHNSGSKQYYMKESYLEIVNNSDEVQYLDGVIISAPAGNQVVENAWQAEGITDKYPSGQGAVVAFPGNGTDYPLLPGQSVLVANNATNHKQAYDAEYDDEEEIATYAVCPDLSKADWEIYLDYTPNDVDYDAPNLDVIFTNNKYMFAFGLGVMGRSYLLAKLPAGMNPAEFGADETNLSTEPNFPVAMQYLMIPSKYVLDAVDVYNPEAENHVCTFLPCDDATGVKGNPAYSGLCLQRKIAKTENGRVYYQDTNSSADDFVAGQPLTPGVPYAPQN